MSKFISIIITASLSLLAVSSPAELSAEDKIQVGQFSSSILDGWENKSFKGETEYVIKNGGQKYYLQASSRQSASALFKKIKVDIDKTPYLNWSWRIDQALSELNEKEKNGDDYAARVYVVFKTGFTPLSARALNYIWSSNYALHKPWPNAFTAKAIMIPLRTSQDKTQIWQHEKVNIKQDLLQYFDKSPSHIEGVAIMTDTDNSKNTAAASYGDIYFSSH